MTDAPVAIRRPSPVRRKSSDLELLRTYEPVLAFTEGEMFFPMRVEGYIRRCSLTTRDQDGVPRTVVERGRLSPEVLARIGANQSSRLLALRFVDQPLAGRDYAHWRAKRPPFKARGRLARVGLIGRLADAGFRLTFFARGRVPGGTAAAAQIQYEAIEARDPGFAYYGRVFRRGGFTVLNYQFFYAMNDWRSSFFGVNDHEADWEQVFVYLVEGGDGELEPAWLAYASHDYAGADLRRRWDDPDLTIAGKHPVVYIGAGSHASYFQPGEYVTSVELNVLKPVSSLTRLLARFWRDTLGQGDPQGFVRGVDDLVSVPFVDYARGDGVRIGPGESFEWTPVVIDDGVHWVDGYRGLWGLDTRDVFSGELAPAGPKYNRDGSVRQSWYDPIGWAALDLEAPPAEAETQMARRIEWLEWEASKVAEKTAAIREIVPQVSFEVAALDGIESLRELRQRRKSQLSEIEANLKQLAAEESELHAAAGACQQLEERRRNGYRPGPKDHIRRGMTPEPAQAFQEGRIAELWAAVSIGMLLVLGAALVAIGAPWFTAIILLIGGSVLVDHILRGSVVQFLLDATIVLALLTALVLVYQFFWWLVLVALALAGLAILANNLREVRQRIR